MELKEEPPAALKASIDQAVSDDDNRFDIPTDQTVLQSKNEVIYSDGSNGNINSGNNTDLYSTQSNDLDTRLK